MDKLDVNHSYQRLSYDEYLRLEFKKSTAFNLSAESELIGTEASHFKQQHGGKLLGIKVLEALLKDFRPLLNTLPYRNCTVEELLQGVDVSEEFVREELKTRFLIARSNAAFEYGSPPGILNSGSLNELGDDSIIKLDCSRLERDFKFLVNKYDLDQRTALFVLLQPQLFPVAGGVVYSSFTMQADEPVIIEASTGSSVSATEGLENLVHYRVGEEIEFYNNFSGSSPNVIFIGDACYYDYFEHDLCLRELDLYKTVAKKIEGKTTKEMQEIWSSQTCVISGFSHSPLSSYVVKVLSSFAKFAEKRLGKPVKLEFAVDEGGAIYVYQLDPAVLEVSDQNLDIVSKSKNDLLIETPFVNMPVALNGLPLVVEGCIGSHQDMKSNEFVFVGTTTPLNINIQGELLNPYPKCQAIVAGSGSRMNHTYSDARTYLPMIGCVGLYELLFEKFPNLKWGYSTDVKVDIRSNGKLAQVRFYQDQ